MDKYGYACVRLNKNGARALPSVHRLVAMSFIPNPHEYSEVNHIDEDKTNNKVENLEWCTVQYNTTYGTCKIRAGLALRNRPDESKPVLQYSMDGKFIKEYPSLAEAARSTGAGYGNIRSVADGGFYHKQRGKWVNVNHAMGYKWKWAI